MHKNLVIVESPAKAKTIEKFLGNDYKVLSSYGHIRDLKKNDFSIDLEHNFAPNYEVPIDKRKLVNELKEEASSSETVWLASDEDREGEAIAWHLAEVLELDPLSTNRIVFHEITKSAILGALKSPRHINIDVVNAQQARRVLDRIVGFQVSPVLWRKVKPSLSAGRVQSVAVRLIVEQEREIQRFKPVASYRVIAVFPIPTSGGKSTLMKAELSRRIPSKQEAMEFLERCKHADFKIDSIVTRPSKKSPAAPFTTSTLQQEAARKLGYPVSLTMRVAQKLYESGFITYMRTDSLNLSQLALDSSKQAITEMMGANYVKNRHYATHTKGAQEAHEAIRPTDMERRVASGSAQEMSLYELIWKRTLASQMADAQLEKTTASIAVSGEKDHFVSTGEVIKFDGFLRVYKESFDDEVEVDNGMKLLPPLSEGQVLNLSTMEATERFTQRPARFTEASLVRKLEELGIGRPSTYAPTISTIQHREYVEKKNMEGKDRDFNILTLENGKISDTVATEVVGTEKMKLFPTDIGIVVTDFLLEYIPNIMNYNFTANIEKKFDEISMGNIEWQKMIGDFYTDFHPQVEKATELKTERKVGERLLGVDPVTGKNISVKIARYGAVAQLGDRDEEEKPLYSRLSNGLSIETITLEEALELFKLPRTVGSFEDAELVIATGRFGPYVRHDGKFYSIKDIDPLKITAEEAIAIIQEKREIEAKKEIQTFDGEDPIRVLNGRYGPYISYKKTNYRIAKSVDPATLTLEDCQKLIEEQDKQPKKSRRGGVKKTAAKPSAKSAAKKATAKKASADKKATAAKKATTKKTTKPAAKKAAAKKTTAKKAAATKEATEK